MSIQEGWKCVTISETPTMQMTSGFGVSLACLLIVGRKWPCKYITLSRSQLSSTEKVNRYEAAFAAVFLKVIEN